MIAPDPRQLLARRLRALREDHWPGRKITQHELAVALGGVSVPLISSWESQGHPRIPPLARLDAYAVLFASPRSFDGQAPGPLDVGQLTSEERQVMRDLRRELGRLRGEAMREGAAPTVREVSASLETNPWRFDDGGRVTIVCAQLPQEMLDEIPYTHVDDPDYIELLTYSELDSLFELHGHIRATNPNSEVYLRTAGKLTSDDYHTHLAVLGGVDWNVDTRTVLAELNLPVRQVADWSKEDEQYFEVEDNGTIARHRPMLGQAGGRPLLREDVALFARAVNPFNSQRTITICNGMYGRGTYGTVRALTDSEFRDRNAAYVQSHFGDSDAYCILTRVQVIRGETLTPDWTASGRILFEWSQ